MHTKRFAFFCFSLVICVGLESRAQVKTDNRTSLRPGQYFTMCSDGLDKKKYVLDTQGKVLVFGSSSATPIQIARLSRPARFNGGGCRQLGQNLYFYGNGLLSLVLDHSHRVHDYFSGKNADIQGVYTSKNLEGVQIYAPRVYKNVLLVPANFFAEPSVSAWISLEAEVPWRRSQWFRTSTHGSVFYSLEKQAFFVHNLAFDITDKLYFEKISIKNFSVQQTIVPIGTHRPNCQELIGAPRIEPKQMNEAGRGYEIAEKFEFIQTDSCGQYTQTFDWSGKNIQK